MGNKWTIRKYPIRDNGKPDDFPWFVFPPGAAPPETHDSALMFAHVMYRAFPEALAYVEYQIRKAHLRRGNRMAYTIEQLEALKEGADNAPWRPEYDEGDEHWVIAFDHPKFGGRWDKGISHGEETAKLFAAAPDLVDALIAEMKKYGRLKEELGKLINLLDGQRYAETSFYEGVKFAQHECRDVLARILEADDG